MRQSVQRSKERGFSLLTTAVSLSVLMGMLGLTADLGRMYVAKDELQAYVDASALAAAYQLDGTMEGIENARRAAVEGPNRWDFDTQAVKDVRASFAASANGPWFEMPGTAGGYRFVKVAVATNVSMYFLPVIPKIASLQSVAAAAVAGQGAQAAIGEGVAPFSVAQARLTAGASYTVDYIDLGQGNLEASVRDAVVNNSYYLPQPLTSGDVVRTAAATPAVGAAIRERFLQDVDTASENYKTYLGNGRRLLVLPVHDGAAESKVAGFAAFLIHDQSCAEGARCRMEYVGPAVLNGSKRGAGAPGLYAVKLFQ